MGISTRLNHTYAARGGLVGWFDHGQHDGCRRWRSLRDTSRRWRRNAGTARGTGSRRGLQASQLSEAAGGGVADERRHRAGNRADGGRVRRALLQRRVEEKVASQREQPEHAGEQVGAEPEFDEARRWRASVQTRRRCGGDPAGGNRTACGCAASCASASAFVPLIECCRAARDQRRCRAACGETSQVQDPTEVVRPKKKPMAVLIRMKQVMRGLVSSRYSSGTRPHMNLRADIDCGVASN